MLKRPIQLCILLLLALMLGACATTGVQIERAVPGVAVGSALTVQGEDPESVQASEWALRDRGWQLRPDAGMTLRVYTTHTTEARIHRDPFCDSWHWHPYHWGMSPYHSWGRYHRGCGPWASHEGVAYPVRTLTWAVEDGSGRLLWQASARETRPAGPPIGLAGKLGDALGQWKRDESY